MPSGVGIETLMPAVFGQSASHWFMPQSRSICSAGSKMNCEGHHLAGANLLGAAVGDDGDLVTAIEQGAASSRPPWPAPTMAIMAGGVWMSFMVLSLSFRGGVVQFMRRVIAAPRPSGPSAR